jgi:hypothetical protein
MKTGHIAHSNHALLQKCIDLANNPIVSRKQETDKLFPGVINSHFNNISLNKNTDPDPQFKSRESNPHNWNEFQFVLTEIKKCNSINTIESSWFNIMPYGALMKAHSHAYSTECVLIYYVNSNPEHPPLELFLNGEWKKITVVSGDWVSFPNKIRHKVGLNLCNDNRISIAINYNTI